MAHPITPTGGSLLDGFQLPENADNDDDPILGADDDPILESAAWSQDDPLSQMDLSGDSPDIGDDPLADAAALRHMVDVEDAHAEEELCFTDARDDQSNSVREKQKNALKHFNFFLKVHCAQKKVPTCKADDLIFDGTDQCISEWDTMIGCFFSYLAKHARCGCDPKKERVSYNTATGYASSIKAYFVNRFRAHAVDIPVFRSDRWKHLRVRLLSNYEEEHRATGKSMVNPHEASSKEDREAIGTGCIWLNTPSAAVFWHLNVTMTQYAGRGSEVALDRRSRLGTTEVNELHCSYDVIEAKLKRQKFGKESRISINVPFPRRIFLTLRARTPGRNPAKG
jgi:hypothetical protein